jgi:hypothetical protein
MHNLRIFNFMIHNLHAEHANYTQKNNIWLVKQPSPDHIVNRGKHHFNLPYRGLHWTTENEDVYDIVAPCPERMNWNKFCDVAWFPWSKSGQMWAENLT